jgi:protein involved in polysaccharide export with SLBB domain
VASDLRQRCPYASLQALMSTGIRAHFARVSALREVGRGLLPLLCKGASGLLLLSALAPAAFSQTSTTSPTYRVNVGDVLQVEVAGRSDISGQFTVSRDGEVKLPLVGSVPAAGRTIGELGADISRRISLISRDIRQVSVSVLQAYIPKIFVLGAVLLPGPYSFAQPPTVWEAIAEAGGPAEDANLSAVEIISEAQVAPTIVDVAAVPSDKVGSLPRLRPGDTVRVPRGTGAPGSQEGLIYVFGAVGSQGPQPLKDAPDLVRAIINSNPSADANLKAVQIVRRNGPRVLSMKVNVNDYLGRAIVGGNPELRSGDTVYLSRKPGSAFVRVFSVVGSLLGVAASIVVLTQQ